MERIITIDMNDYDERWIHFKRPSVRGVIIKDHKVAMVFSKKFDYYKFPGGGIETNEDHISALKREILEETGLTVMDDSIKPLGSVLRIQKSRTADNEIFNQENVYYLCNTDGTISEQSLDDYESDEGFTLEYVEPELAISVNRIHDHSDYDLILIERETKVLEYLIKKEYI